MKPVIDVDKAKNVSIHGFKAALNLMDKWGWTAEEKQNVLCIKKSAFFKFKADPSLVNLNRDQLERISYLLNIHQALRIVFDNPENVYGFVNMPNNNDYFFGKTPREIMTNGNMAYLYEVYKRIDSLRNGGW